MNNLLEITIKYFLLKLIVEELNEPNKNDIKQTIEKLNNISDYITIYKDLLISEINQSNEIFKPYKQILINKLKGEF